MLEIFGAVADPSTGMRSAGAQRVVRACVAQGAEFVARMIERHPNELGRLLQRWVRDERARVQRGDGGRMDIVEQMERLAQRGVIDRPMRLPPPPRVAAPEARADSRPLERPAAPAEVRLAPPRAESRQFEKVSPRAESRQFEKVPPRADSRQFEKVSPRADSRQFEKVAPRAESRQFEKVAPRPEVPRADSRQVEKVLPSAESRPETARPAERADSRSQEAALPGGKVLAPPPRLKDPNAQRSAVSPPGRRVEAPAGSRPPQEAPRGFRDVIAQREARKAGVLSSRLPPGRGDLSGSAPAARIMRDGKLMRTTGSRGAVQRPRALTTSPPLQDIPKRRGGGTTETARSGSQKAVVLKNRPGDKKS